MKKDIIILVLTLLSFTVSGWAQIRMDRPLKTALSEDRDLYNQYFQSAADEFDVPVDVLKGISFAETRWSHLTWASDDTVSCMGMPHPYGIMSLWDNSSFGHSLRTAAKLIGKDVQLLKDDPLQNIRGAAALLKALYDSIPIPEETKRGELESWRNAIAAYSGLPKTDFAQQHALDVYSAMNSGFHKYGIDWEKRPVKLDMIRNSVNKILQKQKMMERTTSAYADIQPDYPKAKWVSSYPDHWYTSGYNRSFVVIHDMEGYYLSTIAYFQKEYQGSSPNTASVYYCINGLKDNGSDAPAGEVTQMVQEKYWAWHVGCWNRYMFGIEHEGFVNNPAWYTPEMYDASSQLVRYLCDKYNIPKDRNHIIGHNEWQNSAWVDWVYSTNPGFDPTCNNHTDPGQYWDWDGFMKLVNSVNIGDFYNSDVSVSSTSVCPGEKIAVSARECYSGSTAASKIGNVYLGYYLSKDTLFSASSDKYLGQSSSFIGSDNPFDSVSDSLTIPSGTFPDTYYLLSVSDYNNQFAETNENNNVTYTLIKVNENTKDVAVYPNPVSDDLTIEMNGNIKTVGFEIFNSMGQLVFKGNILHKTVVHTARLAKGIYLIKFDQGKTFKFDKL